MRDFAAIPLLSLCFLLACAGGRAASRAEESLAASPGGSPQAEPNGGRAPVFSPDGTRIAFLSATPHTPPDLWVMNADGSGKKRLTTRGASAFRWSSDGRAIHIVARRKGYDEVLAVDAQGRREERVPGLPPNASLPVFSSDGTLFAFTAPGEGGVRDLWIGTSDRSRIEAVTEKINVRSFFWGPDGRKIYYETGKSYGLGLWQLDLASMALKPLVSKYMGSPELSAKSALVAYPFPTGPGEFEVRTMKLDGTAVAARKAPRLEERWLTWSPDGAGVYYLGRSAGAPPAGDAAPAAAPGPAAPHGGAKRAESPEGPTSLWHLDLESGAERRVSPADLHVLDFSFSPDGKTAVVTGVLPASRGPEIFHLDPATGETARLATSRPSEWMPVPSPDATRIVYATNEGPLDALRVTDLGGEEKAAYPGFVLDRSKLFWLPRLEGLLVLSERGLHAFSEKGPVAFPNAKDFGTFLYADVSLQEDKVALSVIPRYGETPGLYVLEVVDGAFALTDLRYPSAPEEAAQQYLQPRWSGDGRRIAFTDGIDVWTMNADGKGRRRLTAYTKANKDGKRQSVASFPNWSVRGDRLAYTLTVYEGKSVLRQLWTVAADGTSPRRVFSEEVDSQLQVFLPEYTSAPFFDPSDTHLIATALHRGLPNVVSIDLAKGKTTALTEGGAVFPAMLPEEDSIVYTSLQGNDERIWMMNADGTGKRPFPRADRTAQGGTGGDRAASAP